MKSEIHKSWNLGASLFFPIITLLISAPLLGHALHLFIMRNNHRYDNPHDYHNYHTRPRQRRSVSPRPQCFKAEYPYGQRKWEQYQVVKIEQSQGRLQRVQLRFVSSYYLLPFDRRVLPYIKATIRDYYDMWRNELSVLYYDCMTCQLKIIKSPRLRKWWQLGVFFSSITCLLD
ncbi:hypothetical protein N665_0009s0032 [Sinapis alba]|nr:hypothetical protein N665_0009s0032 [Sinapis alba]